LLENNKAHAIYQFLKQPDEMKNNLKPQTEFHNTSKQKIINSAAECHSALSFP